MGGGGSKSETTNQDVKNAVEKAKSTLSSEQKAGLDRLIAHFDQRNSENTKLYHDLQQKYQEVCSSNASNGKEVSILKDDVLKKDEKLETLETDLEDKKQKVSELEKELTKMSTAFEAETKAHINTYNQHKTLQAECNSQRAKIESLGNAKIELHAKCQNLQNVQEKLESNLASEKETLKSLRESKEILDKDHKARVAEAAILFEQKINLENSDKEMKQKLQALEKEKIDIENAKALQQREITLLKEKLAKAETSLEATKCDLAKVTQDRDAQKDAFIKQQKDMNETTRADKQQASIDHTNTLERFAKGHSEDSERMQKAHKEETSVLVEQMGKERETAEKALKFVTDSSFKMLEFAEKCMERATSRNSLEGPSRQQALQDQPGIEKTPQAESRNSTTEQESHTNQQ